LEGEVESHDQRAVAEDLARTVKGVRSISNDVIVKPQILPVEIKRRIEAAFERSAEIDADAITVEIADNGTVILQGFGAVGCGAEGGGTCSRSAPGVLTVENRIQVVS
jgi:osmotically-inducible protein OsmY